MRLSVPLPATGSVLALLSLLSACAPTGDRGPGGGGSVPEVPSTFLQTSFRVEGGSPATPEGARLPSGEGETAVVLADRPFVVRMEVEGVPGPDARFGLQIRRNGGAWEQVVARDFPYPDEISTPRVSIVSGSAISGGFEGTTVDALTGSTSPFMAAEVVSLDSVSGAWSTSAGATPAPAHGEWIWPMVVRLWADGAVTNEGGDVFELRMVDGLGRPVLPSQDGAYARVVLEIPEGLLGGTYAETPGVLGPWQARSGDLYFPMEPAETFNVLMMMRSSDGGRSWREVDGANRPATDDLEGFATAFHDGSNVGEVYVDQAWSGNQVGYALNTLSKD